MNYEKLNIKNVIEDEKSQDYKTLYKNIMISKNIFIDTTIVRVRICFDNLEEKMDIGFSASTELNEQELKDTLIKDFIIPKLEEVHKNGTVTAGIEIGSHEESTIDVKDREHFYLKILELE
jgi:hypothetical protein